jgi:hypothetical protein
MSPIDPRTDAAHSYITLSSSAVSLPQGVTFSQVRVEPRSEQLQRMPASVYCFVTSHDAIVILAGPMTNEPTEVCPKRRRVPKVGDGHVRRGFWSFSRCLRCGHLGFPMSVRSLRHQAAKFFAATTPEQLPLVVGLPWLSMRQGIVLPSFVPLLSGTLGLSSEGLRSVLRGASALVSGRLVDEAALPSKEYQRHTKIAGLRTAGIAPGWILEGIPIFDGQTADYGLVQAWLERSQKRRDRLDELHAPGSLIDWEDAQIQHAVESLAELAMGLPMRWRSYAPRNQASLTCTPPQDCRSWVPDTEPMPAPDAPLQVAVLDADRVAIVYPNAALVLRFSPEGAIVEDAFPTYGGVD